MYIKNIFDVKNYKGLEDGTCVNFDKITYIVGDNAKNKTTIGALPIWILTGYNLFGGNRDQVFNDVNGEGKNSYASMTIIDNDGTEHIITRCKGKNNYVMLDGVVTTQEIMSKYYKDVHAFLCAYNPNYFGSMGCQEQQDLLLRILPPISTEVAFSMLNDEEQEILENPILNSKEFCKETRAEIKNLNSKLSELKGSRNTLLEVAAQQVLEPKIFQKEQELFCLEQEYEKLMESTNNFTTLDEIKNDIKKLTNKINDNVNIELKKMQDNHKREQSNLDNVSLIQAICPTCKQPVKNENLIKALKITYRKNINIIEENIKKLKTETLEYVNKRQSQIKKYEAMNNQDIQAKINRREELKKQIDVLEREKTEIDLYNKELEIQYNQITSAKNKLKSIGEEIEKIETNIEKLNKQIDIAKKLSQIIIQKQMEMTTRYLKNVTIELRENDENFEYEIKYNGRKYEKLSKSYKTRADLEVAILINTVLEIQSPIFLDDIESVTSVDLPEDIQIIIAKVVKYNDLEILYSYKEVLLREKESINKKIKDISSSYIEAA